jgi:hypothetical protein
MSKRHKCIRFFMGGKCHMTDLPHDVICFCLAVGQIEFWYMEFLMSRVFLLIESIERPSSSRARTSDKPPPPGRLMWHFNYLQKLVDCNFCAVPICEIGRIKVSHLLSLSDLSYIRRRILRGNFFSAIYLTIIEDNKL